MNLNLEPGKVDIFLLQKERMSMSATNFLAIKGSFFGAYLRFLQYDWGRQWRLVHCLEGKNGDSSSFRVHLAHCKSQANSCPYPPKSALQVRLIRALILHFWQHLTKEIGWEPKLRNLSHFEEPKRKWRLWGKSRAGKSWEVFKYLF